MIKTFKRRYAFVVFVLFLLACRKEHVPADEDITPAVSGFFLLNEGAMNTNMASLDYYDYTSGDYRRDIYKQANPDATLGLGDVGNDIGIYGSKLYVVVNLSNKIEVMDVATGKRIKTVALQNGRYITFSNGKAYASAYTGPAGNDKANGGVFEIDTTTLEIERSVEVGRDPEEMAVVNNKLYVAQSGGRSFPDYERTVTVIDLYTFKKTKDIDVAVNLHRLKADADGDIYVTSIGDYDKIPSRLFVIDTQSDEIKKTFDIAASNLSIAGDSAYIIGSQYNHGSSKPTNTFHLINTKTETLLDEPFIKDGTEASLERPYGIAVDPFSRNIYITDPTADFLSSGKLYGYDNNGKRIFTTTAGNIPAHFAFVLNTAAK